MKFHLPEKKNPWIISAIAFPVLLWSLSEIMNITAIGLNRKSYQSIKKHPSEASIILSIKNKGSVNRKYLKEIKFPLSRKSDLRFDHERFDLRIFGLLEVEKPGLYWIGTESDDGSWIWIDGKKILDNGGFHAREEKKNFIQLEKGLHSITVKFENILGEAYLDVFWIPPNETRCPLPLIPNPYGRIISGLYRSAHLSFKIAQYWIFLLIPILLYGVLFPFKK